MAYLKSKMVNIQWDPATKQYILPYKHMTKVFEVSNGLPVHAWPAGCRPLFWKLALG